LGTVVAIFVYLLPGMYDPENGIEKRVPFLIMLHFLSLAITGAFCTLNEAYLKNSNGILLFGTLFFAFIIHLSTFMFEFKVKPQETAVVMSCLIVFGALIYK